MQGVYRQRSYDNLQNGKSPFHRSSIKSLHLPPSYSSNQIASLNKRFSLSVQKFNNNANISNNNINNNNNITNPSINRSFSASTPQHQQQAIPTNFKFVSPQSKYDMSDNHYDSNSLPRYPYHKNRAIHSIHQRYDGTCVEYYRNIPIRHPTTPPPAPPIKLSPQSGDEQVLLPTPTSSTSSGDNCSEWDPMIASGSKIRNGIDHMSHYRACKKQLQQATQLLHPNPQQQMYIDNYFLQLSHQSPYRKYMNTAQTHQLQLSPQNVHQVYHNPGKRHSNVYEYHYSNFDLNSIHEEMRNDS